MRLLDQLSTQETSNLPVEDHSLNCRHSHQAEAAQTAVVVVMSAPVLTELATVAADVTKVMTPVVPVGLVVEVVEVVRRKGAVYVEGM